MKSSTIKNIVVRCGPETNPFWEDEIKVDSEIFDDPLMEAATQAVEKRKNIPGFKLTVIIECFEKKYAKDPMKHYCYNTYYVMINAGMYKKAELLRVNFKKSYGSDLKNESIKGDGYDDGTERKKRKPRNPKQSNKQC